MLAKEASPPRSKGTEALLQRVQQISTWDSVEKMEVGFCTFVNQLPTVLEVCDKEIIVTAMEGLHGMLTRELELTIPHYKGAEKSYSEALHELIDKHPYVVKEDRFKDKLSGMQKTSFELHDETISENMLRITDDAVDEERAMLLLDELQKAENNYIHIIGRMEKLYNLISCVDCFIKSKKVEEDDDEDDHDMSDDEDDDDMSDS